MSDRPPWLTPIQYDEPPEPLASAGPPEEGDMPRPGPHDEILGLDDDDEVGPAGLDLPDDDIE